MRIKYIRKPYKHQHDTVVFGLDHGEVGLLLDPGTGKTKIAVDLGRMWSKLEKIQYILVTAPLAVLWNWEEEVQLNSHYKAIVLYGTASERIKLLQQDAKFYIINYDAIIQNVILKALLKKGFGAVIFDESIMIKNWKSKRTRAAYHLARNTELYSKECYGDEFKGGKGVILSGRAISKGVEDLFGQFWVLDGGKTFGKNFYRFRSRYFRKIRAPFPKFALRDGALASIRHRIERVSKIYTKEECLDLPKETTKKYRVILTKEQNLLTQSLKEDGAIRIHKGCSIEVDNPLVMAQKEQQITGGFIYADHTESGDQCRSSRQAIDFKENPKLQVLQEILDTELGGRCCIIVAHFRHDLDNIMALLKSLQLECVEVSGRTNTAAEVKRYCESDIPICLCQISAGSLGIDGLQHKASDMVFYSFTYRLDEFDQMKLRILRHGQKKPCTYYILLAQDSVDEEMMQIIEGKQTIENFLMRRRS